MNRRGPSASSGNGGNTPSMVTPAGISSLRSKPGSVERSTSVFALLAMVISIASWRRSARFSAPLRKETSESEAEARRMLSRPEETAGKETPAIKPTMATTIIISMSVTPLLPFYWLFQLTISALMPSPPAWPSAPKEISPARRRARPDTCRRTDGPRDPRESPAAGRDRPHD